MPLAVSVVTPEREIWSGEASFVLARAAGGEIGVLAGHAPFLGALHHAQLKITHADGEVLMAVHGGFIEVFDDHVTVLSPVAELASEIDVDRARRALDDAKAALRSEDTEENREGVRRAETRLVVAGGGAAQD